MHSETTRNKMFRNILFAFLLVTSVQAQLNGEFWWLNSKLNNLKKVRPSPPNIEVSDFENDESAKIVFRDDDLLSDKVLKPLSDRTPKLTPSNNSGEIKIVWPSDDYIKSHDVEVFPNKNHGKENIEDIKSSNIKNKNEDILVFNYPKNEKYVTVNSNKKNTASIPPTSTERVLIATESSSVNAEILLDADKLSTATNKDKESQNICTYTIKNKCYELNGFVYEYSKKIPKTSGDEPLVCCILPIQPILNKAHLSDTIHFPRTASTQNRQKRSNIEENIDLNQRHLFLKQKFSQRQNMKTSTPLSEIVSLPEDDYEDPYWNIKNIKLQIPNNPKVENTKYDYYYEDQEYTEELPKPGLIGLYSDHDKSPLSWSLAGGKGYSYGGSEVDYVESDEEDYEETFGYSSIDPRKGHKKHKQKGKPVKLTTSSDEEALDAERHTINFQSDPDFHVFQGFKLLNLFRNTTRVQTKRTSNRNRGKESLLDINEESEIIKVNDENQIFVDCGKAQKVNERGNLNGQAASGSHPWLALVVLTKSRHNVLCYATLVHPRAAVTMADCVHGKAAGDITVIAGLLDLNDRSRSGNRVATVYVHPRYRPGDVDNNLAVLYWMRPLKLSMNIQPACIGEPQIGDECKFYGWGGLDQATQGQRSRWQRASIRPCSGRIATNKDARSLGDAFCVSAPRGSVTGMGGPLICEDGGRSSVVGVIVSRDNGYVLLPVRDWEMKADSLKHQ